ncbi:hypothetical protein GGX14DRAFT_674732 [Mycena pura]|uniref:Uncharacterized protein n=1 Tax=Mycena pura TaxID=153505 RepID=A0AAD6Y0S6_9AGAR|nr:hypothetical protein GGX14DRAFT_674732 [Mycena pura]
MKAGAGTSNSQWTKDFGLIGQQSGQNFEAVRLEVKFGTAASDAVYPAQSLRVPTWDCHSNGNKSLKTGSSVLYYMHRQPGSAAFTLTSGPREPTGASSYITVGRESNTFEKMNRFDYNYLYNSGQNMMRDSDGQQIERCIQGEQVVLHSTNTGSCPHADIEVACSMFGFLRDKRLQWTIDQMMGSCPHVDIELLHTKEPFVCGHWEFDPSARLGKGLAVWHVIKRGALQAP